jgi:hypothetical protein
MTHLSPDQPSLPRRGRRPRLRTGKLSRKPMVLGAVLFSLFVLSCPVGLRLGFQFGPVAFILLSTAALILLIAGAAWSRAWQVRQVKEMGYRLCLRCRYDLRDSPDQGVCPECGDPYEASDLRWVWRVTLGELPDVGSDSHLEERA